MHLFWVFEPATVENVPPRHEMQLEDVTALTEVEYVPLTHSVHNVDAVLNVYDPTAQDRHVALELAPNTVE